MGVLGAQSAVLFCEGTSDSLDQRLLGRLVDGLTPAWTIVPARTKTALRRFAEGYTRRERGGRWLGVRDRDYDQVPPPQAALLPEPGGSADGPIVCLHRHAVENYLLEGERIAAWWQEARRGGRPEFQHPESAEQLDERLERAGRQLLSLHAVRWALGVARAEASPRGVDWAELPSQDSLHWDACIERALMVVRTHHEPLQEARLRTLAVEFRERFEAAEFWDQRQHLVWFSGKDLLKQAQRQDTNLPRLAGALTTVVDRFDWEQHPDLVELRARLERVGGQA